MRQSTLLQQYQQLADPSFYPHVFLINEEAFKLTTSINLLNLRPARLETLLKHEQKEFDPNFIESQENLHTKQIMTLDSKENSAIEMDD